MNELSTFRVEVKLPRDVTADEMKEYIEAAVVSWKGALHPKDPLFRLDAKSVRVVRFYTRRDEKTRIPWWRRLLTS